MNVRRLLSPRLASVAAYAVCFLAATAHAQAYPSKPVRMIVPFAAGGILDIVARAVGERLSGSRSARALCGPAWSTARATRRVS